MCSVRRQDLYTEAIGTQVSTRCPGTRRPRADMTRRAERSESTARHVDLVIQQTGPDFPLETTSSGLLVDVAVRIGAASGLRLAATAEHLNAPCAEVVGVDLPRHATHAITRRSLRRSKVRPARPSTGGSPPRSLTTIDARSNKWCCGDLVDLRREAIHRRHSVRRHYLPDHSGGGGKKLYRTLSCSHGRDPSDRESAETCRCKGDPPRHATRAGVQKRHPGSTARAAPARPTA